MGVRISGGRVGYGDNGGVGSKDMQTGENSTGGPGTNPRAQKPVVGKDNFSTVNASGSPKTTRPSTGRK